MSSKLFFVFAPQATLNATLIEQLNMNLFLVCVFRFYYQEFLSFFYSI